MEFSVCIEQKDRKTQEDRLKVVELDKNKLVAIVCDGHNGEECAEYIKEKMIEKIDISRIDDFDYIKQMFQELDDTYRSVKTPEDDSGSTASFLLVTKNSDNIVINVATLGDSRSVIYSDNISSTQVEEKSKIETSSGWVSSIDHEYNLKSEGDRMDKAHSLFNDVWYDFDRGYLFSSQTSLGVQNTRAFGDFGIKDPRLSSEDRVLSAIPFIFRLEVSPGATIVLASDGLWRGFGSKKSSVTNNKIKAIVENSSTAESCCNSLRDTVINSDNLSLVVIKV